MSFPVEVQYGITATGSASSANRVYGSNVVAGNMSVVLVSVDSSVITTSTVADSQGNTYTQRVVAGVSTHLAAIWTAPITSSGACTVTWTKGVGEPSPNVAVCAVEVSGTSLAIEATASGIGTNAAPTTSSLVTTVDTLMLGFTNVDLFQTPSAGAGWVQRATLGGLTRPTSLIDRSPAAGSYTAVWSVTGSGYVWHCVAIAIKESAAAAAGKTQAIIIGG